MLIVFTILKHFEQLTELTTRKQTQARKCVFIETTVAAGSSKR